jgi:hypothetical protein
LEREKRENTKKKLKRAWAKTPLLAHLVSLCGPSQAWAPTGGPNLSIACAGRLSSARYRAVSPWCGPMSSDISSPLSSHQKQTRRATNRTPRKNGRGRRWDRVCSARRTRSCPRDLLGRPDINAVAAFPGHAIQELTPLGCDTVRREREEERRRELARDLGDPAVVSLWCLPSARKKRCGAASWDCGLWRRGSSVGWSSSWN